MRRRYEDDDDDDDKLDEPVTITGRQLRSLTRGARLGLFGLILGIAATGLAVWSLFASRGPEPSVATTAAPTEQPSAPAESSLTQAMPSSPTAASPTATAPVAATSKPPATTVKATAATKTASVTPKRTKASSTEKPVTMEGSSLTPDVSTPIPIPPDTKPAARDTTGSR